MRVMNFLTIQYISRLPLHIPAKTFRKFDKFVNKEKTG